MPRDQWPPSALRAFWEPLRDLAEQRLKSPRHESRWFNLAGFVPPPRHGLPARRDPDQGPLAGLPPGGQARQGPAMLGRVVDPLAAGGRRAVARASRRDLPPARPVPAAGQRGRRREEGEPTQARAARAGRDVAVRRQPGAARRPSSRNRSGDGAGQGPGAAEPADSRPLVPRPARRSRAAVRAGEHDRPARRPPSAGSPRCSIGRSPPAARRPTRSSPCRNSRASRATARATSTTRSAPGPVPPRRPRRRRGDLAARPRVPRARDRAAGPGPRRRAARRASLAGERAGRLTPASRLHQEKPLIRRNSWTPPDSPRDLRKLKNVLWLE